MSLTFSQDNNDETVQKAAAKSRAYSAMLQVAKELGWPTSFTPCLFVVDRMAVAEQFYNKGPRNTRLMVGDQYRWLWGIFDAGTVVVPLEGGRSIPPDYVIRHVPERVHWYYWDTQTLTPITRDEALRLAQKAQNTGQFTKR
jgi:hypothetical protein